jgi:hypothetical protein
MENRLIRQSDLPRLPLASLFWAVRLSGPRVSFALLRRRIRVISSPAS